tara:strand:+ start:349 stop:534 length:186 start_codon:yes stop_codon:yes gene_type:complete
MVGDGAGHPSSTAFWYFIGHALTPKIRSESEVPMKEQTGQVWRSDKAAKKQLRTAGTGIHW